MQLEVRVCKAENPGRVFFSLLFPLLFLSVLGDCGKFLLQVFEFVFFCIWLIIVQFRPGCVKYAAFLGFEGVDATFFL